MKPAGRTRVWRKTRRATQRGIPTGRRATRRVETAYGQQQRIRDYGTGWAAERAQWRAVEEVSS
jgi:hypothetical protein